MGSGENNVGTGSDDSLARAAPKQWYSQSRMEQYTLECNAKKYLISHRSRIVENEDREKSQLGIILYWHAATYINGPYTKKDTTKWYMSLQGPHSVLKVRDALNLKWEN